MTAYSALRERASRSRNAFLRHRESKRALEQVASAQSRRALDWMNFFLADVQTGFGAFVAFYLARLKWSQEDVGFALTAGRLAGGLGLLPGGALADALRYKRALTAAGILMIAAAALILAFWPTFAFVVIAEILHGLTGGITAPAVAAISLGIVSDAHCPAALAAIIDSKARETPSPVWSSDCSGAMSPKTRSSLRRRR